MKFAEFLWKMHKIRATVILEKKLEKSAIFPFITLSKSESAVEKPYHFIIIILIKTDLFRNVSARNWDIPRVFLRFFGHAENRESDSGGDKMISMEN